jgi:hypothetical protein
MGDSNSRPSRCKRDGTATYSTTPQDLTATPSPVCTRVCTSEPENANAGTPEAGHQDQGEGVAVGTLDADQESRPAGDQGQGEGTDQGDPLAKLAAALLDLSPADRARLAAMLTTHQGNRGTA